MDTGPCFLGQERECIVFRNPQFTNNKRRVVEKLCKLNNQKKLRAGFKYRVTGANFSLGL